ncbi:MAG: hypothetical protein AB8B47_13245 [Roseobacter sp.]
MNDKTATRILWVFFNLGSFVATTLGIASQIKVGENTLYAYALAAGIAAVIQSIVLLGWPVVGRAFSRRAVVLVLIMTLISLSGSILSGTFASTTYIKQARATFLAETHEDDLIARAVQVLSPVTDKALSLQRLMQGYERFATDESEREGNTGDSCDGSQTVSACGPICRLRAAQAGEAQNQASAMRDLVTRIDNLRSDAVDITQQSQLVDLTKASNAFLRDPLFDRVVDWAESDKAGFEGRGFQTEGKQIQCRDSLASERLSEIITAARVEIALAPTPKLRDQTYADVATKNIEALITTVQAGVEGREAFSDALNADPARQFLPLWIISLIIETACACLGLALLPVRGPFSKATPEGVDVETMEIIDDTFNRCAMWQGNQLYFFVPFDGADETLRSNAQLLVRELWTRPFARRGPILIDHLMSEEEAERYHMLTGATMAEAFIVKNPQKAEQKISYGRQFNTKIPAE